MEEPIYETDLVGKREPMTCIADMNLKEEGNPGGEICHISVIRPFGYSHHFIALERCNCLHKVNRNKRVHICQKDKKGLQWSCMRLDFDKYEYFKILEKDAIDVKRVKECFEKANGIGYQLCTANCQHFVHQAFSGKNSYVTDYFQSKNQCGLKCTVLTLCNILIYITRIFIPVMIVGGFEYLEDKQKTNCLQKVITWYDIQASCWIIITNPLIELLVTACCCRRCNTSSMGKKMKVDFWTTIIVKSTFMSCWYILGYMISSVAVSLHLEWRAYHDTCEYYKQAYYRTAAGLLILAILQQLIGPSIKTQAKGSTPSKSTWWYPLQALIPIMAFFIGYLVITHKHNALVYLQTEEPVLEPIVGFIVGYIVGILCFVMFNLVFFCCFDIFIAIPDLPMLGGLLGIMLGRLIETSASKMLRGLPFLIFLTLIGILLTYLLHFLVITLRAQRQVKVVENCEDIPPPQIARHIKHF